MKSKLLFLAILAFITALLAFRLKELKSPSLLSEITKTKKKNIVRCGPDWEALKNWIEETDIPPIPGAGIYKWKISTSSDSAQFYFNQGINMYYSFHIIEAMASFKKAEKFDDKCPIIHWAQALTYGPNINDFGYRATPEALAAVKRAKLLSESENASAFEKELINAILVRYTGDSADVTRLQLNQSYTDEMKNVYEKNKSNADAMALYADAMMLQHPWDLWHTNGIPKSWTPLIRELLEKLLAKYPNHPGGNHYYIHLMEPSPFAAEALPSAERLGKTNPGLSHVVHMPSHIYLRTGLYNKGVQVNVNAVNSYLKSIELYTPVKGADFLYLIHNLHMKTNNAMMAGNEKISVESASETINNIPRDYLAIPPPMGNYVQYIYMTPAFVSIRFGKWDNILKLSQPDKNQIYANVLYHFARGMAFTNRIQLNDANKELEQLRLLMKDSSLALPFTPFSSSLEGAIVAENLLAGAIALKEKKSADAITAFTKAASTEENMVYNEPRDWLLNPKHYLGNAYLEIKNGKKAEEVFKKDLQNNNENGWALSGLYKALRLQNKNAEAAKVLLRFKIALPKKDINKISPVY